MIKVQANIHSFCRKEKAHLLRGVYDGVLKGNDSQCI